MARRCRFVCFFFKQKTAYEMRISDWSSDVCSSDLVTGLSFATEIDGRQIHYADGDVIFPDILSGRVPMITLEVPVVRCAASDEPIVTLCFPVDMLVCANGGPSLDETHVFVQIGSASCRVSVCQYV